jgi:putative membrane protein
MILYWQLIVTGKINTFREKGGVMRFLVSILLNGLLIFLIAQLLPGVSIEGYGVAVMAGLVLGIINFLVKPVIILLTLPVTILTLGLFLLVINGAMVLLADALIPGFEVHGLGWAILFSILLTLLNSVLGNYKDKGRID